MNYESVEMAVGEEFTTIGNNLSNNKMSSKDIIMYCLVSGVTLLWFMCALQSCQPMLNIVDPLTLFNMNELAKV